MQGGAEARPTTLRKATVIEGGYLKEPWVVPLKEVSGREFMCLAKQDRKLARWLGLDIAGRSPWG